jgi:hypothetical protein
MFTPLLSQAEHLTRKAPVSGILAPSAAQSTVLLLPLQLVSAF